MKKQALRLWLNTNQGVAVILTALLGLYLIYLELTPWVHRELRDGFTLGFFPVAGVVAMVACSVAIVFDRFRNEVQDGLAALETKSFLATIVVLAGSFGFFQLAVFIGFLVVSPFFLFILMFALGLRPIKTVIIVSVVMTVVVWGIFWGLGLPLPSGVLPF